MEESLKINRLFYNSKESSAWNQALSDDTMSSINNPNVWIDVVWVDTVVVVGLTCFVLCLKGLAKVGGRMKLNEILLIHLAFAQRAFIYFTRFKQIRM